MLIPLDTRDEPPVGQLWKLSQKLSMRQVKQGRVIEVGETRAHLL